MAKKLQLKIVTPEKLILDELVDQVSLPTQNGEITILPDHIPLISALASGDIVAVNDGEYIPMAIVGGFVELKKNDTDTGKGVGLTTVVVLADFAEHVSTITDAEIEKAKARAEVLRKQAENKEVVDFEHFESELERSLTRVKIADKWRSRKYRK
jgi:F-type H+-transporting ATPase subunit epsilon